MHSETSETGKRAMSLIKLVTEAYLKGGGGADWRFCLLASSIFVEITNNSVNKGNKFSFVSFCLFYEFDATSGNEMAWKAHPLKVKLVKKPKLDRKIRMRIMLPGRKWGWQRCLLLEKPCFDKARLKAKRPVISKLLTRPIRGLVKMITV